MKAAAIVKTPAEDQAMACRLIADGIANIRNGIERAAAGVSIFVELYGKRAVKELCREFHSVPASFWRQMIEVASGRLHPRALATGCSGTKILARLSLSKQEAAITHGLPVLFHGSDDVQTVPAYRLTAKELNRAISRSGAVRSGKEQAAIIQAERRAKPSPGQRRMVAALPDAGAAEITWRVEGQYVRILSCPTLLAASDLRQLLRSI